MPLLYSASTLHTQLCCSSQYTLLCPVSNTPVYSPLCLHVRSSHKQHPPIIIPLPCGHVTHHMIMTSSKVLQLRWIWHLRSSSSAHLYYRAQIPGVPAAPHVWPLMTAVSSARTHPGAGCHSVISCSAWCAASCTAGRSWMSSPAITDDGWVQDLVPHRDDRVWSVTWHDVAGYVSPV